MQVEDGKGTGYKAEVNSEHQLFVKAVIESHAAHASHENGKAFVAFAIDAGPVAAEYPLYFQNTDDALFRIDEIWTSNVDADVIWKLHSVSGTAAGAAVVTAVNLNLSSGVVADATCRGGAGGVTSLTIINTLHSWYGGAVYDTRHVEFHGALVLGKNDAIAIEYDAGTGGACAVAIFGHYE